MIFKENIFNRFVAPKTSDLDFFYKRKSFNAIRLSHFEEKL